MLNLKIDDNNASQWADWVGKGKTVKFDEKTGTIKRVGLLGHCQRFFRPSKAKKADQQLIKVVTEALRTQFEKNSTDVDLDLDNPANPIGFLSFADRLYKSKCVKKLAPDETARFERYSVAVKRQFGFTTSHYEHSQNKNFFEGKGAHFDPRLLGVSEQYAENHPDYVDFLLQNNIYYQRARVCAPDQVNLAHDENGIPKLPFAEKTNDEDWKAFDETKLHEYTKTWDDAKTDFADNNGLNPDGTLKAHHMTKWGLLNQESFMWEKMTPITKIEAPDAPCFQIASYHPKEKLTLGLFEEQGHSGMVFVDKEGYVYSVGFYCHPDSNFYAAFKAQPSAIRSPDLYEGRVDLSWQSIALDKKKAKETLPLAPRWNDGLLQFNFADDAVNKPCLQALLNAFEAIEDEDTKSLIAPTYDKVVKLLAKNSKVADIEKAEADLLAAMNKNGVAIKTMNADMKFDALMGRIHGLQGLTKEAIENNDWSNGALPYLMSEINCTHVSRYYMGQFAEINLGLSKAKDIVNTRPGQGEKFLPSVKESPFSRWKWAVISIKTVILSRVMRALSLTPIVSTHFFGRGKATKGINMKPRTSFFSCLKNVLRTSVAPQLVREEAMGTQFKINSTVRKVARWIHRPSGAMPIHR